MFVMRFKCLPLLAVLMIQLGTNPTTYAAAWSDNFNDGSATDGNPVSWLEDLGGSGLFPGIYSASTVDYPGDYVLDPDAGPFGFVSVTLVPTVSFGDTYIRAQGIIKPDPNNQTNTGNGGNLALLGRVNPSTLDSYLLYVDVNDGGGGTLQLQYAPGGDTTAFPNSTSDPVSEIELASGGDNEIILELNIVGHQLSGYAWQPGQPKPATPQVTATIADPIPFFAGGVAGLGYQEDDPNAFAVVRYVSAQDTPFIDGVPGDYNGNGRVDGADYVVWRNGGPLQNEVVTLASVTPEDYDAWRARFGNVVGSGLGGGAAVPEPTGLLLALAGIVACGVSRSRRA